MRIVRKSISSACASRRARWVVLSGIAFLLAGAGAAAAVVRAFLYWAADLSRGVENDKGQRTGSAAPDGDTPVTNDLYTTVELRAG